jgi:hypothetical protein
LRRLDGKKLRHTSRTFYSLQVRGTIVRLRVCTKKTTRVSRGDCVSSSRSQPQEASTSRSCTKFTLEAAPGRWQPAEGQRRGLKADIHSRSLINHLGNITNILAYSNALLVASLHYGYEQSALIDDAFEASASTFTRLICVLLYKTTCMHLQAPRYSWGCCKIMIGQVTTSLMVVQRLLLLT